MRNNSLIYSDILQSLRTTVEVDDLLSQVDILLTKLFKINPVLFGENLKKTVSSNLALLLQESLGKNNINQNDQSAVEKFLNGLRDQVQQLKVIKLQIAFDPSDETINNIFTWVSENLGKGIILEISHDPSLIGGAIIAYEGKYKDLSLKKRFADIFQKNTPTFKKPK